MRPAGHVHSLPVSEQHRAVHWAPARRGRWVVLPWEILSKSSAVELKSSFILPLHLYSSLSGVFYEQIDMILTT